MKQSLIYFILFFSLAACDININTSREEPIETQTLSQSIDANNAETVSTSIEMKAGKLIVTGGAKQLMDADFVYNYESWEPEITYETEGETGFLTIEQPKMKSININFDDNEQVNEWTVKLNDNILQDLSCNLGAGETDLDLRGLALNSVDINAGVGEHKINLQDCSVPTLEIQAGVGEVSLDLTGEWRNDLNADIKGGIGELNLLMPGTVGIRLKVTGGLGEVNVPSNFQKDGRTYTNDLYESAEYRLEFDIKAGLGSINVEVEELI